MKLIKDLTEISIKAQTAVTLGKFDGLHLGHQKLIHQVLKKKEKGYLSTIFTFDRPPQKLLTGSENKIILTNEEKQKMLEDIQIDLFVQCPFTKEIAQLEPEDFVKDILKKKLHVGYLVVGTDFRFGYQRRGDIDLLNKLAKDCHYHLMVLAKEQQEGHNISSTYIKELISQGEVEKASEFLGYPYFLSGKVIRGKQLGRAMGIPTANIIPDERKILPPNGVYASKFWVDGHFYYGMTNIGLRPTVEDTIEKNVETYLFDFEKDIYEKEILVELLEYERKEIKFDSVEALKRQLSMDKEKTQEILEKYRGKKA
ncbi:MAG: bifunctional riboflavin kinase/FAD synthetase [Lachnospiraceae bacterium]|jgi:riboflavin kinase/FMN adenylyltransferase|nr:bifunctional riboflavin kinase/FAD synthetase [Lachnospiraceae bacterium]